MKKNLLSFLPSLLLFLAPLGFIALYLGHEKSFLFWDYAMYPDMVRAWMRVDGIGASFQHFVDSFKENYNLLYALPSFLTFSLFGDTRLVFVATNYVFFLVPQLLGVSLLLRSLYGLPFRRALSWAFVLSFLLPFFWQPLLENYPDHGGGACIALAAFFAIQNKRTWREALTIGFLLGLAVVFRRPYAYSVAAFIAALGLCDFGVFWREKNARFALVHKFLGFYALLGLTALGLLLLCEPFYIRVALATDIGALYGSYDRGGLYFLTYFLSRVGLLLLLAVLAGFALGWRGLPSKRPAFLFIGLFFFLWLALWALGPAQADPHYFLAAAPLFCVTGLRGLFVSLKKPLLKGAVWALLAGNAAFALWFASGTPLPSDAPQISFFSAPRPPERRADYDALLALTSYLGRSTTDGDRIAVVSSSFLLNQDLIQTILLDVLKAPSVWARFIPVSEIDTVQPPSFDALAAANVYVVPEPAQYHLPPDGQRVLESFASLFPPPSFLSPLFEKDAQSFTLDRGVRVSIWRRKAWPPALLHEALAEMRRLADKPERKWVLEKSPSSFLSFSNRAGLAALVYQFAPGKNEGVAFFDFPLGPGLYRVTTRLSSQPTCQSPVLSLLLRDGDGRLLQKRDEQVLDNNGLLFVPFVVPETVSSPVYLSLALRVRSLGVCLASLSETSVEKNGAGGLPTPREGD